MSRTKLKDKNENVINPASDKRLIAVYTGNITHTYEVSGRAVGIQNNGDEALIISVNSIDIEVGVDMTIGPEILDFGSFTEVTVTTTESYQLFIYE